MNLGKLKSFRMLAAFVAAVVVLALAVSAIPASAEIPTDISNFKGAPSDVSGPFPTGKIAATTKGGSATSATSFTVK